MAAGRDSAYHLHFLEAGYPKGLLFVLLLLAFMPLDEATDTLYQGQSLSGNQTIVSKGGVFELGFFRPGESSRFYVGIWYTGITPRTVVWVANRASPVSDPSTCQFTISVDGTSPVLLLSGSNTTVWPPSLSNKSRSYINGSTTTFAVLHDTGNFVVESSKNPASSLIVWQSFDHPTDTWLPGAPLGRNKTTGETQKLVSWKSNDDPAPGRFSLALDPAGSSQYFLTWNGSHIYWTTGLWNGRLFTNVPEMEPASKFCNFTFIDNATWISFYYTIFDQGHNNSRRVLDSTTGQLRQYQWVNSPGKWNTFVFQPSAKCQVYALCGPFGVCVVDGDYCRCLDGFEPVSPDTWRTNDWSDGCARRMPLRCDVNSTSIGNASASAGAGEDKFKSLPSNIKMPADQPNITNRDISSQQECDFFCLKYQISNDTGDCSCTAYSFENGVCSIWVGDLLNLHQIADADDQGGTLLHLRVSAMDLCKKRSHHDIIRVAVVIVGFATGVVSFIALCLLWLCRKRKARTMPLSDGSLTVFRYRDLQLATKNFSEKLGAGGFGSVFRGVLSDATVVAVKKLAHLHQGEKQFRAEVSTLGKIQHLNLVRLHGFCSSGPNRLLVYEFMPNGSLDRYLFDGNPNTALSWRQRFLIMVGIARALAYLHDHCSDQIVHCDIKPENILLDEDFCPKVADFGMAKLIGRDFSRALTTMRGTRGYLAPEWISGLPITSKADVYSYGMMLFELVSGKRNSCELQTENANVYRPLWSVTRVHEGRASELADASMEGDFNEEELGRACRVACWCIQDYEESRPAMRMILQVLEGVADLGIPPIPTSLLHLNEESSTIVFYRDCSSVNL